VKWDNSSRGYTFLSLKRDEYLGLPLFFGGARVAGGARVVGGTRVAGGARVDGGARVAPFSFLRCILFCFALFCFLFFLLYFVFVLDQCHMC
jgi:hypothetical protein